MKIALGSAQFGLNYGINNKNGKITDTEISKIFSYAKSVNINTIDTAQSYGNAEKVIGEHILETDFKIITKIVFNEAENINSLIIKSLNNLKINKLYGLLFHDFKDYLKNPALLDEIKRQKDKGKLTKYGFSLYYPEQLERLFEDGILFDLVQVPYNVADRRFEKYFRELKEKNIEIHVRSIFLQGLFFINPNKLNKDLEPFGDFIITLNNISSKLNLGIENILINYVYRNALIDKMIIGIDNVKQLRANISELRAPITKDDYLYLCETIDNVFIPEKLLIPSNWRLTK